MKAARKKRRSFTQMMEEDSGHVLRERLPRQWAIHGYAPDYGIDGAVEIFDFTDETEDYAETLGESFLFQLKSTQRCDIRTLAISGRRNVEKGPYQPSHDVVEMEVVRYNFDDTDELLTIEAMGYGAVVVLFLVCLEEQRVFFLNLTDHIDKVLTPESPGWRDQGSKVIYIPIINEVRPDSAVAHLLLRYYAIRPKLMALFTKIHFQWAELGHGQHELRPEAWHSMALHFIEVLLRFDVWAYEGWTLLAHYREQLEQIQRLLVERGPSLEAQAACMDFWFRMDTLSRTFEDVTREWGLPTALGYASSYPYGT
jgi:hypothetical protein